MKGEENANQVDQQLDATNAFPEWRDGLMGQILSQDERAGTGIALSVSAESRWHNDKAYAITATTDEIFRIHRQCL